MIREQNGTIILRAGKWYCSYWDRVNLNGEVVRKRVTRFLGPKTTRGKHPPVEIRDACKTYMDGWNARNRDVAPMLVVSVAQFWQDIYLPWLKANKRASTVNGYEKIWRGHLREHFGSRLLRAPAETPHYTAREMQQILFLLSGPALVAMALAFIGLRPSEIRGLRWEDIDFGSGVLHVCRSAWRGILSPGGKGKRSVREVTLGPAVLNILREYLASHPSRNGFVLENRRGGMLDLDYLAQKVIRPALKSAGLEWKGFYAGRRGAETEMNRYTNGNSQVTAHHFGHTKAVADAHYIKPLPDETKRAALALDLMFAAKDKHFDQISA